ncbi:MAG: SoxR reducing system RseC family protein [Deltaproteobacteria bacterium]
MPDQVEGVVIETNGETAKVRCSVHSDCENCGVCPGADAMIIEVDSVEGLKPGDSVLVDNRESNMARVAFMVYIFPLLVVGCGIILGYYLSLRFMFSQALSMTIGGLVFGVAAIIIIKHVDKSLQSAKPIIRPIK